MSLNEGSIQLFRKIRRVIIMDAYELRKKRDLAPYDDSMLFISTIYDHLIYTMDVDLCPRDAHKLISGNIIKGFRYNVNQVYTVPLK
jgi:hypothetical protein